MARLLVRFVQEGASHWGEVEGVAPASRDDRVRLRPLAIPCTTTAALIGALEEGFDKLLDPIEISAVDLLSPITEQGVLVCQGLNYGDHAREASHADRKSNLIFGKASSSISGPYDPIVRPTDVQLLDYEVEFALVLRRDLTAGARVDEGNLADYVAGVVLCNDVSARDVQFGESLLQWFRGKSYRSFCPTGPVLYLFERDEVVDLLQGLQIKLWVNDDLRQTGMASELIWKPAETLSYVASIMDMRRGDMLLTGTPGGVTAPVTPHMVDIIKTHLLADEVRRDELRTEMTKGRPFLHPGDVVTARLTDLVSGRNLGGQQNIIVDPA